MKKEVASEKLREATVVGINAGRMEIESRMRLGLAGRRSKQDAGMDGSGQVGVDQSDSLVVEEGSLGGKILEAQC